MKVAEIMSSSVVSVRPDDTVSTAARLMARYELGSLPVTGEEGKLKGMVTDRDIVTRCVAPGDRAESTPVREIMTKRVNGISPGEDARAAANVMAHRRVRRLPVTGPDGTVIGMVSLGDIAGCAEADMEAARALSEISENIRRMD